MIGLCPTCNTVHERHEGEPCDRTVEALLIEQIKHRMVDEPPPGSIGYLEKYGTRT